MRSSCIKEEGNGNRTIGQSKEWNIATYEGHNCQFTKMAVWSERKVLTIT